MSNDSVQKIKMVAFDLDGVLLDTGSSWVTVHRHFKTNNNAGLEHFLEGKLNDEEFIKWDVSLWLDKDPELNINTIKRILYDVPMIPGTIETIEKLKERYGLSEEKKEAEIELNAVNYHQ